MTKQTYVRAGGVWKPCTSLWTKAGGVWKQDAMPLARVGGVFKECMDYDPYAPVHGNEFIWNGLTYKVVVKDYGGGVVLAWLDRNLGATRVATSVDDSEAYGNIYQFGRSEDGHEQRNSLTTATRSSTDNPGHGNFITTSGSPYDWRSSYNYNLWQSSGESPCPPGWWVPAEAEFVSEIASWSSADLYGGFNTSLKWTSGGYRSGSTANIVRPERIYVWTRTLVSTQAKYFYASTWDNPPRVISASNRSTGCGIRCVRSVV